jgi:hypothetical protein
MPLSKSDIDPEHIEAMRAAFRRVCNVLQVDYGREDPMTEIIVIKIAELAKTGEYDPVQVSERVLAEFNASHGADAPDRLIVPVFRFGGRRESSKSPWHHHSFICPCVAAKIGQW